MRVEATTEVLFKGEVTKASEIGRDMKKGRVGDMGTWRALPPLNPKSAGYP